MPPSSETVTLTAPLHARPAAAVVRAAARFTATVEVRHGNRTADARSVLAVIGLNATRGSTVTVYADGPDAEPATAAVAAVLTSAE